MKNFLSAVAICVLLAGVMAGAPASAQKKGGVLRIYQHDSPASMSIHEEALNSAQNPMMAVFNNLVIFKQDVPQNRLDTIVPDLATKWSWNDDYTELTFRLRRGVSWHDGKPFTAADVKCTWDLILGNGAGKTARQPAQGMVSQSRVGQHRWRHGDVPFKKTATKLYCAACLRVSPVYPCHVPPQTMRQHPIGTGPFKFVSYKPNESIKLVRNPNYWKQGRPYLDGIEWTIIPNRSTAVLAFVAGKFDMTFPFGISVPLMHDINKQAPRAHCDLEPANQSTNLVVNRDAPPFDNPDIRLAMALALDRKSFIDVLAEGHADVGGAMQPPPQGVWGMPAEMLRTLPGYDPDVAKNRAKARELMQKAGYGPDKRLAIRCPSATRRRFAIPPFFLSISSGRSISTRSSKPSRPPIGSRKYTAKTTRLVSTLPAPDRRSRCTVL